MAIRLATGSAGRRATRTGPVSTGRQRPVGADWQRRREPTHVEVRQDRLTRGRLRVEVLRGRTGSLGLGQFLLELQWLCGVARAGAPSRCPNPTGAGRSRSGPRRATVTTRRCRGRGRPTAGRERFGLNSRGGRRTGVRVFVPGKASYTENLKSSNVLLLKCLSRGAFACRHVSTPRVAPALR